MFSVKRVDLPTGVTIDYAEQGDPSGPTLILLHAIADSRRIFEPILEQLPHQIHVLVPSKRGHGDSSRPPDGYRPEDFATDLAAFVEVLRIDAGVVVGGSSGGVVARRFAIDHPDRVRGLVLLGSPFSLRGNPSVEEMWETIFSKLADPIDAGIVRDFAVATTAPTIAPEFMDTIVEENLKAPAVVWRETMRGLLDDTSSEELGHIAAPTLIMWGEEDTIIPRSDQDSLLGAIPNARLVTYPGRGHGFYLEDPSRVAADLAAFERSIAS